MRRTTRTTVWATAAALALACSSSGGSADHGSGASGGAPAGKASPYFITSRNSSDPQARVFDGRLYLYASSDLDTPGGAANPYPMNATYAYALTPGANPADPAAWTDGGAVLRESQYTWVPAGADHLWAPDCVRKGKTYYLYVPDVTDKRDALSSKVGVSTGASPTGPFTPQGTLAITGYASDPSTFIDKDGKAYLTFASGDYSNCGGLSIVQLAADMKTLVGTPRELTFAGIPGSSVGACAGKNRPYLEGPGLDQFGPEGKDQYFLYFAMKPDTENEVIAYATAASPMGPYTYRGIIMHGSGSEWTNQASIVKWGGRWLFFYHDGPRGSPHARKVRGECLSFGADGAIQPLTRTDAGLAACGQPPG